MRQKLSLRKTAFVLFLSCYLALAPIQAPKVQAWDAIMGAAAKTLMDYLRTFLKDIITGAMEQVAIKMVNEAISKIVGGSGGSGGGSGKIITNYKTFLYAETTKKTETYINDYISQTTGGTSMSSYVSAEGIGDYFPSGAGGGDYLKKMSKEALASVLGSSKNQLKTTYVGNPGENLFSGSDLNNFNSYISGINNPWALRANVEYKFQQKLEEEQRIALTKAQVGMGYKGTEKNGTIITPASFIANQMSNTASMNFDVITNANSMSEVVVGMVSTFISQTIQNGIGKVAEGQDQENQNAENSNNTEPSGGTPWVNPDL